MDRFEQIIRLKRDLRDYYSKSSEEFVIPQPEPGEHVQKYISRCIAKIGNEYDKPGQAAAVCYGQIEKK
ncbi:hypothetical protein UFOVP185_26 [uncultured Caudovirales phage]|uniref:Uncharacterized protein n=1 Tax=uncultured Caudovirales phage TaxID=2100421 RepID=A0A6J7WLF8_9CAUD|nr:hypothetical protein UFOVP185_26 [uncultured Caudovirales phage]